MTKIERKIDNNFIITLSISVFILTLTEMKCANKLILSAVPTHIFRRMYTTSKITSKEKKNQSNPF